MEPTSQLSDTPESRRILEGQIRECYGRVVYSHKTHEKCCGILLDRLALLKKIQIALSAITTGTFLSALLGTGVVATVIGASVSAVLLALNAYTKDYDLGELAQKHKQAANAIWLIREQYLSLLTNLAMGGQPINEVVAERDRLLEALHSAYAGSPSTTSAGYKQAQEALQYKEDMTFSDEELDAFLPADLKRARKVELP